MSVKIRRETLEQFVNANGYEIAEKHGVTAASNASGLSRPTVYAILQRYPKQPKRAIPQYIKDFNTSEGAKLFLSKNRNRIKTWKKCYQLGLKCYLLLNKKDPINWTIEDYRKLCTHEQFIDSVTQRTRDTIVFGLRLWMKATGKHDLLQTEEFSTKGLKRPKSRKSWHLEDTHITSLIKATKHHYLLLIEELGVKSGGRISSILGVRPLDCNFEKNLVMMYEPKVKDYRPRFLDPNCMNRVKQYIKDYQITPDKPLFPSYSTVRKVLKDVAKEANIPQLASMRGATHIFKHTFVTQGAFHNLSMDSISEQTGTNPNTLRDFYVGIKEKKLRHELLGEELDVLPYPEWVKTFEPLWSQQYSSIPVQRKTLTEQQPKTVNNLIGKTKAINWIAIKRLTENSKTPEPLRNYWLAKLKTEGKN
ncbi:MAG: site-specific integrase [Candidatus Bathyarchaeota archaeon]|nr:site-specific integrase [Candidatus Termiticorpusculum sp.]